MNPYQHFFAFLKEPSLKIFQSQSFTPYLTSRLSLSVFTTPFALAPWPS